MDQEIFIQQLDPLLLLLGCAKHSLGAEGQSTLLTLGYIKTQNN